MLLRDIVKHGRRTRLVPGTTNFDSKDAGADMKEKIAAEINGGTWSLNPDAGIRTASPTSDTAGAEGEAPAVSADGQEAQQTDGAVSAETITEEDITDYIFGKHPDVKGIYATNGEAVRLALDVMERYEKELALIGYDADADEIEALQNGQADALVVQNPFGMGYAAVIAAARAALSMGNEAVVDTGYFWLTKEKLEDDSIQKMLYAKGSSSRRFRWI